MKPWREKDSRGTTRPRRERREDKLAGRASVRGEVFPPIAANSFPPTARGHLPVARASAGDRAALLPRRREKEFAVAGETQATFVRRDVHRLASAERDG